MARIGRVLEDVRGPAFRIGAPAQRSERRGITGGLARLENDWGKQKQNPVESAPGQCMNPPREEATREEKETRALDCTSRFSKTKRDYGKSSSMDWRAAGFTPAVRTHRRGKPGGSLAKTSHQICNVPTISATLAAPRFARASGSCSTIRSDAVGS